MSKTILLADDSVTIQKVIELTFMDQDWEVVSVSNGDDAIARIEDGVGGLVIADVHMPGASGFDVARRSKDRDLGVPVLLLVGTFEPFEEAEYEASGADAYLKKPFDSQELLELVEELASGTGAAEPAADSDLSDVELDLDEEPEDVDLGDDETFDLTGGDLGGAEEETAGLGGGEPVWGNLDLEGSEARVEPEELELEETEEEPSPVFESTTEEEPEPFRLSDEPGESFALESEAAPPPEAETVRMETVTEEAPEEPAEPEAAPEPPRASGDGTGLSDEDVERIARRVVDLIGESVLRDVAWEVIPDLAEVVIKDRIRELERQIE